MAGIARCGRYLWAAPLSVSGLAIAGISRVTGGGVSLVTGVVEAHGGWPGRLLPHLGVGVRPAAITIGHVVMAVDQDTLERTRNHERVHVAQAERWGILFPLAYLMAAGAALLRGGHPYWDNRFEQEARAKE